MATILVTNDDGVESKLWSKLCSALEAAGHNVWGVAPTKDQSWISSAMTLGRELEAKEIAPQRFAVDGTPADCVGVALDGLIGENVDVVVSGINCGVNTRLPLVLTSGTVGAAGVGAMKGKKAIAFSYAMPREYSAEAKKNGGVVPQTETITKIMIGHCVKRIAKLLDEAQVPGRVLNVNFPPVVTETSAWKIAPMAVVEIERYFVKQENGKFKHDVRLKKPAEKKACQPETEFEALGKGFIAESVIDWANLG